MKFSLRKVNFTGTFCKIEVEKIGIVNKTLLLKFMSANQRIQGLGFSGNNKQLRIFDVYYSYKEEFIV